MSATVAIQPSGPVHGTIQPPGSKSITNRALVCAALADGESTLLGALDSEDTQVMVGALGALGIDVDHDKAARTICIRGCAGRPPATSAELYVANSGTTIRFLTALVSLGQGRFRLDGTARMRQRPIEDLLEALRRLGVDAASELGNGCPPAIVQAKGLPGGRTDVAGSISSQFLSGLLLASPYARIPIELHVTGELVSKPYITMTLAVMETFGAECKTEELTRFLTATDRPYRARSYAIEPDASAASYFFAAAAVTGGQVTVPGLSRSSLQGDVAFCDCLAQMGCQVQYGKSGITVASGRLHGIDVDMNAISDTVQTLAVVALFAEGPTTIRNVGHIRHKETDRLAALATELRKLGAKVEERPDGLRITPAPLRPAEIDTYDDHRMAMSLAIVGLASPGVVIRDPGCTAKTYPEFFADLARLASRG